MVSQSSIADQLKRIGFNQAAWGRAEIRELPNIILPDEEIFECVNGSYEGGFALLVATDVRVLLIDKKPFKYLTVEDLRFDMINEIDYSHRLFGSHVDISTGNRELKFHSYNQERLRKLIGHVQHCMAATKKKQVTSQEGQHQHLQQINDRLKSYLIEQHRHQEDLQRRLQEAQRDNGRAAASTPEPPRPSPELSDYLLAHGLLAKYENETGETLPQEIKDSISEAVANANPPTGESPSQQPQPEIVESPEDLYAEGRKEIFGDAAGAVTTGTATATSPIDAGTVPVIPAIAHHNHPFEVNPLRIAYSKLPTVLRNRKFGSPSLPGHIHIPTPKVSAQTSAGPAQPIA